MLQILQNYAFIFLFPFVIGLVIRLLCNKFNKFYFITIGLSILTIIMFIVVSNMNTHGSEGPMIMVVQLASLNVAIVIVELVKYFRKRNR